MKLNSAFALLVTMMAIESRRDVVASSSSLSSSSASDEADPPKTRKVCTAIIVSTFYILSLIIYVSRVRRQSYRILSYLIFCFVCFLIPFVAMFILLNTKTKNAKKDSKPSSGSTGQLGNSTFGSTQTRCPGFYDNWDPSVCKNCRCKGENYEERPYCVSDNYDCVVCWGFHCNIFQFIRTPSTIADPWEDWEVWASKVIDFSVSKGQNSVTPTSKNIMSAEGGIAVHPPYSPAGGIVVHADRKGTTAVANSFLKKSTLTRPYGLLHYDSHGEKVPEKLNFWVTVDLHIKSPKTLSLTGTIKNVTLGQGSENDWWMVSPYCHWYGAIYQCKAFGYGSIEYLFYFQPHSTIWGSSNNQVEVKTGY